MNESFARGWGFAPFTIADDHIQWKDDIIKYEDIDELIYQFANPTLITNAVILIKTKDGKKRQFVYAKKDKERGAKAFKFVEEKLKEVEGK